MFAIKKSLLLPIRAERCLQSIQSKVTREFWRNFQPDFFFAKITTVETILRCVNPKIYPLSNVTQYLTTLTLVLYWDRRSSSNPKFRWWKSISRNFSKKVVVVCRVSNQYAIPNSTNQNISFSTQLLQPMTSVHICKKTFPIAQVNHVFMALPRHTNGGVTSTLEATVFFSGGQFWSCFKKSSCWGCIPIPSIQTQSLKVQTIVIQSRGRTRCSKIECNRCQSYLLLSIFLALSYHIKWHISFLLLFYCTNPK